MLAFSGLCFQVFFLSFSFCGCFLTCRVRLFKNVHARPRVCVCTYAPGVAGAVVGTSCEVNCVIFFPFFLVVGCGGRLNALVARGAAILCRSSLRHLCLVSVQRLITRADKRAWVVAVCRGVLGYVGSESFSEQTKRGGEEA